MDTSSPATTIKLISPHGGYTSEGTSQTVNNSLINTWRNNGIFLRTANPFDTNSRVMSNVNDIRNQPSHTNYLLANFVFNRHDFARP